ncbi:hypothetical protein [Flavihumibacter petaseus]|uniref:Cytochrome B n=1 Tax=Flavihumibacter petaseus NBRC 106054 TaxID=1220578 RepID=A0A0E9N2F3_9BACT|nr:hypothetical protein [Flavihumibacter petaseus]GAO43500.1 hypothetical protein FPE01S_02_06050 [Flavihumibacter petaseus NBRC 106054]
MYTGLLHLHSFLRWVILVLLIIALVRHFNGMMDKNAYTKKDRKTDLFLMISAHTTFLIGLIQWLIGDLGLKNIMKLGFGEVMKSAPYRFFAVEHFVGMLIAIVLITIGRGKGKPATAAGPQHKQAFWLFLIALVVILASIPWPFREAIARPWFPGM